MRVGPCLKGNARHELLLVTRGKWVSHGDDRARRLRGSTRDGWAGWNNSRGEPCRRRSWVN